MCILLITVHRRRLFFFPGCKLPHVSAPRQHNNGPFKLQLIFYFFSVQNTRRAFSLRVVGRRLCCPSIST